MRVKKSGFRLDKHLKFFILLAMDDVRAVTMETLSTFCSNLKNKVRLKRLVANSGWDLYKSTLFESKNQIWCWKLQLWVPFNISIASIGLDLWTHARKSTNKYFRKTNEWQ